MRSDMLTVNRSNFDQNTINFHLREFCNMSIVDVSIKFSNNIQHLNKEAKHTEP